MRIVAIAVFGFLLLVLQAALGVLLPAGEWAPNLILPVAIYLGVVPDVPIVRGAALAFVLGYLVDAFAGLGLGLHTFVLVATYLIARGTGLNLFMRGPLFQVGLTFLFELAAGGAILALRAIFERPAPFPSPNHVHTLLTLLGGAATTAALAPALFFALARVEQLVSRRREDPTP